MGIGRFKIGFVCGYVVATIRHSKDADPAIQWLKRAEAGFKGVRKWWNDLDSDGDTVAGKLLDRGRYAA